MDQFRSLGNCLPTPPLSQRYHLRDYVEVSRLIKSFITLG